MDTEVLIIGAGPTGLTLALWLTAQGVKARIWESRHAIEQTSRAIGIQARTLELYRQLGLSDRIIAASHNGTAMNVWINGSRKARVPISDIGTGITPYPGTYVLPQEIHEQILEDRLAELGVKVERGVEFLDFNDHDSYIHARAQLNDGVKINCKALYIAGCDGAHSRVRSSFGTAFQGGTYPQEFYVADIDGNGGALNGQLHLDLSDHRDLLLVISYNATSKARIFGAAMTHEIALEASEDVLFARLAARVDKLGIQLKSVNWISIYKVHHRVADHFRHGRAFILGDAAHIHSPAGGQGMNTGIGDSINLAWKLAAVIHDQADSSILDTYEQERRAFALKLVNTTDEVFTSATSPGWLARFVRTVVFPILAPLLLRIPAVARFAFGTVSQINLNYRASPLSEAGSRAVSGGDRVPWVPSEYEDAEDNHNSLSAGSWHVHVYDTAMDDLVQWCKAHNLPLHVFDFTRKAKAAGLRHNAAYLIRPDTYIAAIDPSGGPGLFDEYFTKHGFRLAGEEGHISED
ncbi:hypothetical protein H2200_001865 [Cladophialophora chaetospira]|uniref:FAD-binding domain-containing protein n=1 Tax=Cladophialophora chaetospira TaxID=386627 RepID=A0AA39CNE9_9EURO|nr:hypothetical protein H2200_001865 [Cladophialophora chaetospira]